MIILAIDVRQINTTPFALLSSSCHYSASSFTSYPLFHLFSSFHSCTFAVETSVFTSRAPLSRGACLSLCGAARDSPTITLEEIPRVACQSQLAAKTRTGWRGAFFCERAVGLPAQRNSRINRLLLCMK